MPGYGQDFGYGAGGYRSGRDFRGGRYAGPARGPYGSDYARGRGRAYPTGNFANYGYTGRGNTGRDLRGGGERHFGGPRNHGAETYYSGTQHQAGVLGRSSSSGGEFRGEPRATWRGGTSRGGGGFAASRGRGGPGRQSGYWTGRRLLPPGNEGSAGAASGRGGSFTYPGHRDEIHAYDIAFRNFRRG